MLGLERAIDGDANVIRLLLRKRGKFGTKLAQVKTGDFLIQLLIQAIDSNLTVRILTNINLGDGLVGEAVGHYKTRVAGGAA